VRGNIDFLIILEWRLFAWCVYLAVLVATDLIGAFTMESSAVKSISKVLGKIGAAIIMSSAILPLTAKAAAPDLIKQPSALNLGGTSFYDGFGRLDEGFSFLQYVHLSDLDHATTVTGATNPAFNHPDIQSQATLEQLAFTTPWRPFGGAVAFSAAIPVINFDSHFRTPGTVLRDNGFGYGDTTFGPMFQSAPVMYKGRPVFSWRVQMQIIAPVGEINKTKNINQSSGFWVINPYYAFTVLPTKKWEVSARLHYVYNLETDRFAATPPIPGLVYKNGQAGQSVFANYDSSYAVTDHFFVGVNGFYLQSLDDDKLNGLNVNGSRQKFLYFGPGARVKIGEADAVNLNLYFPVIAQNVTAGTQFNLQYVHRFANIK
jgi:hypothetical protein